VLAELFLITAIETGLTGPSVAIVSFNGVCVSILTWLINGISLAPVQIVGIMTSLIGVMAISLSK